MSPEIDKPQDQSLDEQWSAAFSETATAEAGKAARPVEPAKPAAFEALRQENSGVVGNIDLILDIPVTISVEIGRTKMMVKELLQLAQGAVIELEKLAGEQMEIFVHGKLLARGEAVVVNDKFGVKITDIASPTERIDKLR